MQVSISNILKSIGYFHSHSYLWVFFFLIWFLKFFFRFLIFLTTNEIQYFLLHSTLYIFPFVNFQMYILPVFLSESFFIFFLSFFFFWPGLRVLCILGKFHWGSFLLYILQIVFLSLLLVQCLHYIWYLYRYKNINWTLTWYSICCSKPFV